MRQRQILISYRVKCDRQNLQPNDDRYQEIAECVFANRWRIERNP